MAYIGQQPVNTFSPVPSKDSFTGDGSTTTFDLGNSVVSGGQNALEVFVNNVRQEPGTGKAFTLGQDGSGDLKRITFSAAPASGASIYVINDKTSSTSTITPSDLNGAELILDADADSSITADTDDRIDFKLANTDHIQLGTSSGDTTIKIATDAKDLQFLQADGNKLFEINDGNFVGVGGNSAAPGEIRIYEDTDNGSHYTGFKAGNNTASVAYVLPTADGSAGTSLTTDGSGVLSWSASLSIANDGNNRITTATGSSGLNGEANLQFDGSTLAVTGATTISTNLDVDGTTNLDAVDIDGAVQLDATLTIGANDQGYDIIIYGDTASANLTWDTSVDDLIFNGAARAVIPDGQLVLGSTAVTSTAAELNLLDGVSGLVQADLTKLAAVDSTATELNIVDGDTTIGTTAVADGDGIVTNDGGTMRQTTVQTFATYFGSEITAMSNLVTTGALDSGSITSGFGAIDNGTSNIRSATITAETAFVPDASGGADLGTTALEFNDAFFNDGAVINFGDDQDVTLTHTADTGLTLNSTMKLMFNDASQFIQGTSATVLSIGATDEIDLTATAVDLNGTLNVSGVATFQAAPVFPDGSIAVADLDIDGATDIGADIVDADLFIIDDGAGGTNRKTTAARIKTYIGGGTQWQAVKTANYTAVAGQGVFANTSGGAWTLTLPASPAIGDQVSFIDYAGTFDSNNLTIGRNSSKIHGADSDLTVATERAANTLVFTDSTQGWLLTSK